MKASSTIRSNCEKKFVLDAIQSRTRLDGRNFLDYRKLDVSFGETFGHCEVCLGDTKVLAQVTCEVVKPSQNRPTEGQIFFNLELSAMASPAFESGRPSDFVIELNRFIERCLKASRPIDTESLCIVAGEKVWCIRVDIQVLDDAGNILDCSCIAAITALAHFRLPDVTVTGKDVIFHSLEERDPIPLNVHHMPICVTFGFINCCEKPIVDPDILEEGILDGQMVMAMNSHSEICCAKMSGVSVKSHQIMMCCKLANVKVDKIVTKIKKCLQDDKAKRFGAKDEDSRKPIGNDFEQLLITKTVAEPTKVDITEALREAAETVKDVKNTPVKTSTISMKNRDTGVVGDGGSSAWVISDEENEKIDDDIITTNLSQQKRQTSKQIDYIALSDDIDSEEEETTVITSEEIGFTKAKPIEVDMDKKDAMLEISITDEITAKTDSSNSIAKVENITSSCIQKKRNKKKKKKKTNVVTK